MHTEHTHVERVLRGENTQSHHCGDYGYPCLFGKFAKFAAGFCGNYPSARADKWSFRSFESLAYLFYLKAVSFDRGLVCTKLNLFRVRKLDHCLLNIHRHINKHRTVPSRTGNIESFLEYPRKL